MTAPPSPESISMDPVDQLVVGIKDQPIAHVEIRGTLDTLSIEYFDAFVRCGVPTHRGWLLINAAGLEMLTSSGAGALIRAATRAAGTGGGIVLAVPPGQVREAIRFMRLDMVLDTVDTVDEAVAFIDRQAAKGAS